MPILILILGIAMLTMGRRLYWFFLGAIGFVFAFDLAERLIDGQPHNIKLIIALLAGVTGAALAIFLQKFAVIVGGFLGGGYLLLALMRELGMRTSPYHWLIFVAGGIVGAVLMKVVFGWSLVILSSAVGAVLILQTLHFSPQTAQVTFIILLASGIAVQYGLFERKYPRRRL